MTKRSQLPIIQLKIDYKRELLRVANSTYLQDLYSNIPQTELLEIDWFDVFALAAQDSIDKLDAISRVASQEAENLTTQQWIHIIARAAMKGDQFIAAAENLTPTEIMNAIRAQQPLYKIAITHTTNFLKAVEQQVKLPPHDIINLLNQKYEPIDSSPKELIGVLEGYCQDQDVSLEQMCSAIDLVKFYILQHYINNQPLGTDETLTIRVPKGYYDDIIKFNEAPFDDFKKVQKRSGYYSIHKLPSGVPTQATASSHGSFSRPIDQSQ